MNILGIRIGGINVDEALMRVGEWVKGEGQYHIVSVNPEGVLLAQKDEWYREVVNRAALALADGFGIIVACRALRQSFVSAQDDIAQHANIPERVTGIDLMLKLCEMAAENNWKVYLMGGVGETARLTSEKLRMRFPGLIVDGEEGIEWEVQSSKCKVQKICHPEPVEGCQSCMLRQAQHDRLISRIKQFHPHLLFVALGQPRQELWIDDHLKEMPSVRVAMGVGGAFDFLSGKVPRAPLIMRQMGLEWLWRLIVQPWRFRRIFSATVRFMWLVVKERFKR